MKWLTDNFITRVFQKRKKAKQKEQQTTDAFDLYQTHLQEHRNFIYERPYQLTNRIGYIAPLDIIQRVELSPAARMEMIQNLAEAGLIRHQDMDWGFYQPEPKKKKEVKSHLPDFL